MNVITAGGTAVLCETGGCGQPATSAWSAAPGPPVRSCDMHNPWHDTAMALPLNFTSHSLCHACGQPVRLGGAAC